jgi:TonB-linked SusC/RagA family outer membrane protein
MGKSIRISALLVGAFMLLAAGSYAQNITGTVFDEFGNPAPGVSAIIKGTTLGGATDLDGKFEIANVGSGVFTLQISFIGYRTIEKEINTAEPMEPLTFNLKVDAQSLDELVVVGYGVQRKREVTGSIAKIDSKEITEIPTQSFESSLQGKAAGVQVMTGSGLAGSAAVIRVRGISSISSGGDPLYVVDGVPITQNYFLLSNSGGMNNNPLATINPNDIESVEVLKDAAATGIYGSRGANGVILITTKRASSNKLNLSLNTRWGISQATKLPDMLNRDEYLQIYQEAYENDGGIGRAPLPQSTTWEQAERTSTDWVDQTTGTGFKQLYSLSLDKKTDRYGIYGNFTYDENGSYLLGNKFTRTSGRVNFDYDVSKKFRVEVNASVSNGVNKKVDAAWSGGLGAAMSTALPIYPIYWDSTQIANPNNGEFNIDTLTGDTIPYAVSGDYWLETGSNNNPVASRELRNWRTVDNRILTNAKLIFAPRTDLIFTGSFGYEYIDLWEKNFRDQRLDLNDQNNTYSENYKNVNNLNASLLVNYIKTYNAIHDLNIMLGTEYQYSATSDRGTINFSGDFGSDFEGGPGGTGGQDRLSFFIFQSYFGRVNYMLKDRYIVQLTGRVDGSSRFGPENKFGFFPSASLGWIITEEDFMKAQNVVSYLKLKTSYGRTGNSNLPRGYDDQTWVIDNTGYGGESYLYSDLLTNPALRWETTDMFDVALEVGVLEDRISMEASFYNKNTSDVILNLSTPQHIGYDRYVDNVAKILNRGWEFSLTSRNLVGKFEWTTMFNITQNYNEVLDIGPYSEDAVGGGTNDTRVVVGKPVGTNFLVRFSHVDPESGVPVYFDINGEETTDWDPNDRVPVGKVYPDFFGGMTNNFRWRRWDMSFEIVYSVGAQIYNSSEKRQSSLVTDWNMTPDVFDRWRKPGDSDTRFPRLTRTEATYGSGTPWINTDQWLHDADYLRFRKLSIAYTFEPWRVSDKRDISLRIEGSITNFLTITNYPGLDPEIARDFEDPADRNMSANITYLTPPQERTANLAFFLKF